MGPALLAGLAALNLAVGVYLFWFARYRQSLRQHVARAGGVPYVFTIDRIPRPHLQPGPGAGGLSR